MHDQQVKHLKDQLALIGQQLGAANGVSWEQISAAQLASLMQHFTGQVDGKLMLASV